MTLIEHLRGWDEMPEDDSEAFRWLDLKTAEAADELEFLQKQLVDARRTAEYWKANHLAGNEQLAAAIAACKVKDEALSKIEYLESDNGSILSAGGCSSVATEALAIQPDDDALKAWLGEPVGEVKKHTGSLKDMAIIVWTGKQPEEGTNLYAPKGLK